MSQKLIPGLCDWRIGTWRCPDAFIFNGLPPLKMVVPPWTASGVACGDTLLAGEGLGRGGINGFTSRRLRTPDQAKSMGWFLDSLREGGREAISGWESRTLCVLSGRAQVRDNLPGFRRSRLGRGGGPGLFAEEGSGISLERIGLRAAGTITVVIAASPEKGLTRKVVVGLAPARRLGPVGECPMVRASTSAPA